MSGVYGQDMGIDCLYLMHSGPFLGVTEILGCMGACGVKDWVGVSLSCSLPLGMSGRPITARHSRLGDFVVQASGEQIVQVQSCLSSPCWKEQQLFHHVLWAGSGVTEASPGRGRGLDRWTCRETLWKERAHCWYLWPVSVWNIPSFSKSYRACTTTTGHLGHSHTSRASLVVVNVHVYNVKLYSHRVLYSTAEAEASRSLDCIVNSRPAKAVWWGVEAAMFSSLPSPQASAYPSFHFTRVSLTDSYLVIPHGEGVGEVWENLCKYSWIQTWFLVECL